jgi:hypothetical protein
VRVNLTLNAMVAKQLNEEPDEPLNKSLFVKEIRSSHATTRPCLAKPTKVLEAMEEPAEAEVVDVENAVKQPPLTMARRVYVRP